MPNADWLLLVPSPQRRRLRRQRRWLRLRSQLWRPRTAIGALVLLDLTLVLVLAHYAGTVLGLLALLPLLLTPLLGSLLLWLLWSEFHR